MPTCQWHKIARDHVIRRDRRDAESKSVLEDKTNTLNRKEFNLKTLRNASNGVGIATMAGIYASDFQIHRNHADL